MGQTVVAAAQDIARYRRRVETELRSITKTMATGRAIADARDNPTLWAIARLAASDRETVEVVERSLGFARVKLGTAEVALKAVHEGITRIQSLLTLGLEPGADKDRLGRAIDGLRESLRSIIRSAGTNGLNYLVADVPTASVYNAYPQQEFLGSVARQAGGSLAIRTLAVSGKDLLMLSTDAATAGRFSTVGYLTAIAQPAGSPYPYVYYQLVGMASHMWVNARDISLAANTPVSHIEEMVTALESVRSKVELALEDIGLAIGSVEAQHRMIETIAGNMDHGISVLVDANLTETAARLKALEVRRALCDEVFPLSPPRSEALLLLTM